LRGASTPQPVNLAGKNGPVKATMETGDTLVSDHLLPKATTQKELNNITSRLRNSEQAYKDSAPCDSCEYIDVYYVSIRIPKIEGAATFAENTVVASGEIMGRLGSKWSRSYQVDPNGNKRWEAGRGYTNVGQKPELTRNGGAMDATDLMLRRSIGMNNFAVDGKPTKAEVSVWHRRIKGNGK
jgi:hypothetical protein